MAKTAVIQTRIDPEIKEKAQKVFDTLHISISEAISVYLTQVALQRAIPFEIRIPNDVAIAALKEGEESEKLPSVNSVDQLFEEMAK